MIYLWVAIGSALGGMARYACAGYVASRVEEVFPWGTLFVNVMGSFVIGLVAALTGPEGRFPIDPNLRVFLMVGFCGGYTTFSSFSLQTLVLAQNGDWPRAWANVAVSVAACVIGVWLGHLAGLGINQLEGA